MLARCDAPVAIDLNFHSELAIPDPGAIDAARFADPAAVRTGRRWRRFLPALACVVVVAVCWPLLAHGLQSDDFGLVLANRDLGVDGFVRFLLFADYGDRAWAYWRPGWVLLFWLVHELAGEAPAAYFAVALALHVGCVLVVHAVALRASGSAVVAAAAALLLGLHGAHAEAVVWVAAAFNVLPAAAMLVAATWCAWRFATVGGNARLAAALALAAASLLWKEAAYGFPLVLAAAAWCGRPARAHADGTAAMDGSALVDRAAGPGALAARDAGARRVVALGAAALAFSALIAAHYLLRNRVGGVAGSPLDMARVAAANLAAFVRAVLPAPGGDMALALAALAAAAAAFVVGRPLVRFLVVATVAGTLPYVLLSGGGRFSYFWHAPGAVLLAVAAARALRADAAPWRALVAAALVLAPLALAPTSLREHIARSGRDAATAAAVLDALVADGHAARGELFVDVVPECLMNGLAEALTLRTGQRVRVDSLQAVPRPPFLIHISSRAAAFAPDTVVLRYDAAAARYHALPFRELLGGLVPVPLFALATRCRVVADEAAARALLAAGAADPAVEPLLLDDPGVALANGAAAHIESVRTDIRDLGCVVQTTGHCLLVVAFPVPADFTTPPGAIWIDGEPVRVLRANLLFHAVVVPPGRHDVRLLPRFGG